MTIPANGFAEPEMTALFALSTATSNPNGGGSSTNVGAIAGGVVGGILVTVAIILAFFLIRRRRKPAPMQTLETYSQQNTINGAFEIADSEAGSTIPELGATTELL